jgi:hypothetical protein
MTTEEGTESENRLKAELEFLEANFHKLLKPDQLDDKTIDLLRKASETFRFLKDNDFDDRISIFFPNNSYIFDYSCVTDLSAEVASALVKISDASPGDVGSIISLDNLKGISPDAIGELSKLYNSILSLGGLKKLDHITSKALAGFVCHLDLNGIKTIEPEAIPFISQYQCGELNLNGIVTLDAPLAKALFDYAKRGNSLSILGVTRISKSVARILWPCISYINICTEVQSQMEKYVDEEGEVEGAKLEQAGLPTLPSEALEQIRPWVPLFENNPNFKSLVLDSSATLANYLRQKGIPRPEAFHNLNAAADIRPLLDEALELLSEPALAELKDSFKGKTLAEFSDQPGFIETHKDEVIQALADQLCRTHTDLAKNLKRKSKAMDTDRKSFLEGRIGDPDLPEKVKNRFRKQLGELLSQDTQAQTLGIEAQLKKIEALQSKLSKLHFLKPGEWGCRLASRNTRELTLGDECSDCTSASIGGMNFWTVPVWLTDPGFNFVLQYDENGDLAHKFGVVWEETDKGEAILTLDSMELGNSQKKKAGMDEGPLDDKKEKAMVESAIAFIRDWAREMGLNPEKLFAAQDSNTGIAEFESFPTQELMLSKIGQLEASEKTLKAANPDAPKLNVYLQSLGIGENEEPDENDEEGPIEKNIELGNSQKDFGQVEKVIQSFILDESADKADRDTAKTILRLAKENPKEAARKMNIFLVMQAKPDTKAKLSVDGKRIDVFLNSRGHSLEKYLSAILGQVVLSKGIFQKTSLRHLVANQPKSTKRKGR